MAGRTRAIVRLERWNRVVTKGYQKGVYERVTSGIRGGKGVAGAKARGVFRGYAALQLFSSMTSFTKCSGTSFTLRSRASGLFYLAGRGIGAGAGLIRRPGSGGSKPRCAAPLPAIQPPAPPTPC